jgi:hypothetical protein
MDNQMIECSCKHSNCWYECSYCGEELHEPDIFYLCDDYDNAWCSEICLSASEERGMQQAESQQEDEG